MIILHIAAALSAPAIYPEPYPAQAVLAAVGELCRPIESIERTAAGASRAGWRAFRPDPASPIGRLIAFGETETRKMLGKDGSTVPVQVFTRDVAGENLVAILSGVRVGRRSVNGCRVYDIAEPRQTSLRDVQAWVGRAPTAQSQNEAISFLNWAPGYAAGHDSFELFHIPAGSPLKKFTIVDGLTFKADFVGVEK